MRPITPIAAVLSVFGSSAWSQQSTAPISPQFSAPDRVRQSQTPIENAGTDTPVGHSFTYQGTLMDGGVPANGEYDMQFYLYNDIPDTIDDPICRDNVLVTDGVFTTQLDFGPQFYGDARSIEISVRPGGALGDCDSPFGYVALSPRQDITATPYALGLSLPYAGVQSDAESIFSILNTDDTADSAILGVIGSPIPFPYIARAGVRGEGGNGRVGVLGLTDTYIGVYGHATGASGAGVYGFGEGPFSWGVFGQVEQAGSVAIFGQSDHEDGWAALFFGRSSFNGKVGVNTQFPTTDLDVVGTTRTTSLQIPTDAGAGKVLKSDASGNATWQSPNDHDMSIGFAPADASYKFLVVPAVVTITEGQSILVTSNRAFGTTAVGGALSLDISIGIRVAGSSATPSQSGQSLSGLRLPQNSRVPFSINTIISGRPAGTYEVGMAGTDHGNGNWNSNTVGITTAVVLD